MAENSGQHLINQLAVQLHAMEQRAMVAESHLVRNNQIIIGQRDLITTLQTKLAHINHRDRQMAFWANEKLSCGNPT